MVFWCCCVNKASAVPSALPCVAAPARIDDGAFAANQQHQFAARCPGSGDRTGPQCCCLKPRLFPLTGTILVKVTPGSQVQENELALSALPTSMVGRQQGTAWKSQAFSWRKDSQSCKSFSKLKPLISAGCLGLFLCCTKVSVNRCRISVTKVSWFTSVLEGKSLM